MSVFNYKAVDNYGKIILGRLTASNDADLEMRLSRMGLDLVYFRPARTGGWWLGFNRIKRPELITFCFHLEQLTRAGVPILESLGDLRDSVTNLRFREVIASIIEDIEGGKTLSDALKGFPTIFDPVFINLVWAGEQSGTLTDILLHLTETLKWQDELAIHNRKIIMYPALVGSVVFGVMIFMMVYLVPQLVGFIQNMGGSLPLHTRLLIVVSNFVSHYWYLLVILPPVAFAGLRYWARHSPHMRYRMDRWKLRLWPIGGIYQKILMARFTSNFALLYKAGITVLDSIGICEKLVANRVIEEALERARKQIGYGGGLNTSFENTGLFPPLVLRMLRVGENSSALDTALENVSYFYNRNVHESIARIQTLIEPSLTVILGILLGWVMLSVLGPVYDMLGTITK